MDVKIRAATIKDLNEILKLNQILCKKEHNEYDSSIISNWPFTKVGTDYFKKRIIQKNVFVAVLDKKIVGYLAGNVTNITYRKISIAELENMFVLNEYRSSGIGTKLYESFVKWSKKKKIKKLRVNVSTKNKKGINFYKKNGFKENDLSLEIDL